MYCFSTYIRSTKAPQYYVNRTLPVLLIIRPIYVHVLQIFTLLEDITLKIVSPRPLSKMNFMSLVFSPSLANCCRLVQSE
jgi:hypothetical protein